MSLFGYSSFFGTPDDIPIPSGAEPAVEQAKKDLSKRRGIDKKEIVVVAIELMDWPDTSLGYPEPGMIYAQVITPGYKILLSCLLSCKKEIHEYHSGKEDRIVYCENRSS